MSLSRAGLGALLEGLAALPDYGEPIDQLAHALQTAGHAIAAGADDELVLASALHDVGRTAEVSTKFPQLAHEHAAAEFLMPTLGKRAVWLIRKHVDAKRYLVHTEPYAGSLSTRATATLAEQGGAMTAAEAATFIAHPWAEDALALRRWDDAAKVPHAPVPSIVEIVARYHR